MRHLPPDIREEMLNRTTGVAHMIVQNAQLMVIDGIYSGGRIPYLVIDLPDNQRHLSTQGTRSRVVKAYFESIESRRRP